MFVGFVNRAALREVISRGESVPYMLPKRKKKVKRRNAFPTDPHMGFEESLVRGAGKGQVLWIKNRN